MHPYQIWKIDCPPKRVSRPTEAYNDMSLCIACTGLGNLLCSPHKNCSFFKQEDWDNFTSGWEECGFEMYQTRESFVSPRILSHAQNQSHDEFKQRLEVLRDIYYQICGNKDTKSAFEGDLERIANNYLGEIIEGRAHEESRKRIRSSSSKKK